MVYTRSIKEGLLHILFFWEPEPKNWQISMHWEIPGSPRPIKHCHSQIQYFKAFLHLVKAFPKIGQRKPGRATFQLKCIICQHMTKHSWIHFFISMFFVSLPWSFHPEGSSSDLRHIWSPRKMKRLRTRKQKSGESLIFPLSQQLCDPAGSSVTISSLSTRIELVWSQNQISEPSILDSKPFTLSGSC